MLLLYILLFLYFGYCFSLIYFFRNSQEKKRKKRNWYFFPYLSLLKARAWERLTYCTVGIPKDFLFLGKVQETILLQSHYKYQIGRSDWYKITYDYFILKGHKINNKWPTKVNTSFYKICEILYKYVDLDNTVSFLNSLVNLFTYGPCESSTRCKINDTVVWSGVKITKTESVTIVPTFPSGFHHCFLHLLSCMWNPDQIVVMIIERKNFGKTDCTCWCFYKLIQYQKHRLFQLWRFTVKRSKGYRN